MAIVKHPFGRYQIIDRELRRKDWVKTIELKAIIEDELSIIVSKRMINEDIIAMKYDSLLSYYAPIEYNKKYKAYYYTDRSYTIKAFGLLDDDINALMFYAKTINQYRDYEIFKDFTNAIEKVLDAVTIRKGISFQNQKKSFVQTESTPKLTGSELLPLIIQALDSNRVISFKYGKYDDSPVKSVDLQPYLLKEDRHRWYVIGKTNEHIEPTRTYALDRMKDLQLLVQSFVPIEFDYDQYYKYSFGITVTEESPIDVILSFTELQGKYLKTLKIHHSQEILIDNQTEFRIKVTVKPSWEFYEKILGFGYSVRIVSPDKVIHEFKHRLNLIAEKYMVNLK